MNKTKIEWTDYTSNPIKYRDRETGKIVWGCVRKSPGCAHCYAADLAKRYGRGGEFTEAEMARYECYLDEGELRQLLSPKRLPSGSKVFVGDMTDVFGEWVPFGFLDRLFAVMALRPDVVFQVLTKRPERMREYFADWRPHRSGNVAVAKAAAEFTGAKTFSAIEFPLPNVWLGTSVENQHWADVRIPELLATPAAVRFLSCEPLLGPLALKPKFLHPLDTITSAATGQTWKVPRIGWVIVGGESGPKARPCDLAWIRSIVAQCRAAGVACFVKQLGAKPRDQHTTCADTHEPEECWPAGTRTRGHEVHLKDRKGGDMAEWPEDLRVREMPR